MKTLLFFVISILIVGLFLYSKLLPHKDRLTGSYLSTFNLFDRLFTPVLNIFRRISKPVQVGNGLAVDMSHIFLILILLIVLRLIS